MTTLTKAQRQAILMLSENPSWQESGIKSITLASLKRRGLVRFGWDSSRYPMIPVESLTPNGYELAKKLKREKKG